MVTSTIISADWIKLPNISPTATTAVITTSPVFHQELPKVVFKLAVLPPDSSILSSETMSNIFSFHPTTQAPTTTRKTYIKKYFHTTVTSKVVTVKDNVTDLISYDDYLEPVILRPNAAHKPHIQNKVTFYNKTVAMNIVPLKVNQIVTNNNSKDEDNGGDDENDDDEDGVTITNESDNDEYYDDDEYDEATTKFHTPTRKVSTTTEMPKTHKRSRNKNKNPTPQRRMMIQMMKKNSNKPFGGMNFPSVINFIKRIQESFTVRTAKTIGDKVKMLMSFRDRLMMAINMQIKKLWKTHPRVVTKKTHKRSKRTIGGGGWMEHSNSGAIDFPSAEGALLSICFLTFAVFLIKLVLVSF